MSRLLWAGEDNPQGFWSSYIRKVDERFSGRVVYCSEEYTNILW